MRIQYSHYATAIAAGMVISNIAEHIYYLIQLVVTSFLCFECMRISQFDPNYQKNKNIQNYIFCTLRLLLGWSKIDRFGCCNNYNFFGKLRIYHC